MQTTDPRIVWPREHSPASAVVFAHNGIDVRAPPSKVWSLLIDCVAWPRWYNKCADVSILRGGPQLQAGSKFRFKTLRTYFEPEVVTFEIDRMLVWSAKGPLGTSGAHAWLIEATPTGCEVITEEVQKGLLLHAVGKRIRSELHGAHEDWVRSLKQLAEAQ